MITEAELDELERGTTQSVHLTGAVASLSTATAFVISLLTTDVASDRTFAVFVALAAIGYFAGLVLLATWRQERRRRVPLVPRIRNRMPPKGEPDA